jgi:opacity protein-like surface antigen
MKNILVAIIFAFTSMTVHAQGSSGNANLFLGSKKLDSDDWEPLEQQAELGVMFDFNLADWPVNMAIDLLVSADTTTMLGVDIEATTTEIDFGARKYFDTGSSFSPYIGGGLALVSAELKANEGPLTISDDDSSMGFWVNLGMVWTINQVNFGIDLRHSNADVTLYGEDGEAGGNHIGLLVGYHW